jgi:uncharacterized Fe-S cluster-containing protein
MQQTIELPGLDCGLCGSQTCDEFAARLESEPTLIERCVHLELRQARDHHTPCPECGTCAAAGSLAMFGHNGPTWQDSLGRDFDFYLEHFPEEPGPREIMLPHNPLLTRELEMKPGDIMIGRPLGMSCGCPITHCGVVMEVDMKTGVIVWCVTGPLNPREKGFKDIGYYSAEAYEGLIKDARCDVRIGCRYYFQPRMCMLQWRHSGLVNYLNRTSEGMQVRVEGLWIG